MNKTRHILNHRKGSVLVLVLLIVLITFIIGTGLLALGTQTRITSINQIQDMMARSAADAGLEKAIQEINHAVMSGTWANTQLPSAANVAIPNSDAEYSVQTVYDTDGYRITSVGTDRNRSPLGHGHGIVGRGRARFDAGLE